MASNIGQGTEKLYYADAYMRSFEAEVISCSELCRKGDPEGAPRYAVVLDRTAFFPEEGGQSPDRGTITPADTGTDSGGVSDGQAETGGKAAKVLDVQIREGVITHVTDLPFKEGSAVRGELDFEHRFSNMQQHSAEHIFSGLVHSRCGFENVGFHLSDTEVTMDYSGAFTEETAAELEMEVNRAVWKNLPSVQKFPTEEELAGIAYRSKIEIDGQVRLIIYPGYDICACCAPHVAKTGEIGIFKVISLQNYKGGVRVHMLAGKRAFEYLAAEHGILTRTARFLSTSADLVPSRVEAMKNEVFETKKALAAAETELLGEKIRSIPEEQENVCLITKGLDSASIRNAVNELMERHRGFCAVFDGDDTAGYRYCLGCAAGEPVRTMQKCLQETFGAKGGGKPPMMQGSVMAPGEKIEKLFRDLKLV